MLKILALLFTVGCVLSGNGQSLLYDRCEVKRTGDSEQFEHWLKRKQSKSARKQKTIYRIPVVIHVLHEGEAIGEGFNHSKERIESQIRVLNEDFRKKKGTPGFNTHPDGGDAQIEFVLAKIDPEGNSTDGIVRIDINSVDVPPIGGNLILLCSQYSYWNPDEYLNIWSLDLRLPPGLFLGQARFPVSDLEGLPDDNEDGMDADGIFVNAPNFGIAEKNSDLNFNMGRTLTHEMGHFLGLLHIWGSYDNNCEGYGDYCADTPAVSNFTNGCPSEKPLACHGGPAMIENYMDWSHDVCMNIFTNDQISRMHTVLENSVRRKSLLTSPALNDPVTGIPDDEVSPFAKLYPNPASDRVYIALNEKTCRENIEITGYDLSGKIAFTKTLRCSADMKVEIQTTDIRDRVLVFDMKGYALSWKQLVIIR
jgi:hypothetical protein